MAYVFWGSFDLGLDRGVWERKQEQREAMRKSGEQRGGDLVLICKLRT